ncbi:MAG: nucleotidyltransferase family protein [Alphaproteobacteria bacterium]|nr:nucleotidyltransferase family protein [Alphaproteobacteria bacterium]
MPEDPKIAAVLLAAGESRRMGVANKLLLEIDGEPIVHRTARQMLEAGPIEAVAVLGHDSTRVGHAVADLPLAQVVNPHYRDGQMTSVHAGLAALSGPCAGVMICLADQPMLTAADYRELMRAFAARGDKSILVPTWRGRRGNPVLLAWAHRGAILARQANLGCRQLIDRNPDLVFAYATDVDRFVRDIDTQADYRRQSQG